MKIFLEIHDCLNKNRKLIEVLYNNNTTLQQLFDDNIMNSPKCLSDNVINPLEDVDFYYHNDVLYWDCKINDMLIIDFVKKYPNCKAKIPVNINFGGIGATPNDYLEFATELYLKVNDFVNANPILIMFLGYTLNLCKKNIKIWIKKKSNTCLKFSSFKNSLYEKKTWELDDVKKALELSTKDAIVIMMSMGYSYNKKTKMFSLKREINNN
ncbi:MAG: hypothetical protein RSE41_08485 [Clostridia bacterium]